MMWNHHCWGACILITEQYQSTVPTHSSSTRTSQAVPFKYFPYPMLLNFSYLAGTDVWVLNNSTIHFLNKFCPNHVYPCWISSSSKWSVAESTRLPSSNHRKPVCAEMRGWKTFRRKASREEKMKKTWTVVTNKEDSVNKLEGRVSR